MSYGLFSQINSNGVVKNLNIKGRIYLGGGGDSSWKHAGMIAGQNQGKIQNCKTMREYTNLSYVEGTYSFNYYDIMIFKQDSYAGGIVGFISGNSLVNNNTNNGNIGYVWWSANRCIGGIVGDTGYYTLSSSLKKSPIPLI